MLGMWTSRGANRAAVDLSRLNPNKKDAIEPPVPSAERLVVLLRIHRVPTIGRFSVAVSPFSDTQILEQPAVMADDSRGSHAG
jgi:hypothetical protein